MTVPVTAIQRDVDGVIATGSELPVRARQLVIASDEDYARAVTFAQDVKAHRKAIADVIDPHIRRAYEAHRELCEEKKRAESDAILAERIIKDALVGWEVKAEAIRERDKREQETVHRELATDAALDRAIAADLAGEQGTAAAILNEPLHLPAVTLPPTRPAGASLRETWSAKVTNLHALIVYVAAHPMYTALLLPNQKALDSQARSLKQQMRFAGVEVQCTKDVAIRQR